MDISHKREPLEWEIDDEHDNERYGDEEQLADLADEDGSVNEPILVDEIGDQRDNRHK